jgi:hypothetical protein
MDEIEIGEVGVDSRWYSLSDLVGQVAEYWAVLETSLCRRRMKPYPSIRSNSSLAPR